MTDFSEKYKRGRRFVREALNRWWRSEAAKQADQAIRSRAMSRRPRVDEFGDTVWPDSDWIYQETSK